MRMPRSDRALLLAPLAALLVGIAAPAASAGSVRHLPPAEAEAGAPLELGAEVDRASARAITVHFRPRRPQGGPAAGSWAQAEFRRGSAGWVAIIPAAQVTAPGVEYYIESRPEEGEPVAEFASAADPHLVIVRPSERDERRERDLARASGRRSRLQASAEWVDFGSRTFRAGEVTEEIADRYYRIDASFSYLLLSYPLKAVRIGYTRLLGTTPDARRDDPTDCGDVADCELEAGFKVGGWFELRFALGDGVEIDGRGAVMATSEGFKVGGRSELRVGVEDGNHVALGAELAADVGSAAFFRLGWDSVPGLPMATTIELLDYPASRRVAGVRLVYDVARRFGDGVRVGLRLAYQARDERIGGFGAGLSAGMDF